MKRLLVNILSLLFCVSAMAQSDFFGGMVPVQQKKTNLPDAPNFTDSRGKKQGAWSKKYDNGNYRYQATFKDDQPVGELVRYFENGKKSAVINYRPDGKGEARLYDDSERLIAEGLYIGNKRDSLWRYYNEAQQLTSVEPYANGLLDGVVMVYYSNGDVAEEITYVKGKKEGVWKQYYRGNGRKLVASHRNDLLQGEYKTFNVSGICDVSGLYEGGQEQGTWTFYDSEAQKNYELKYKNGVLQNPKAVEQRLQDKAAEYEKKRKLLKDPEQYRNDPEGYMR